MILLLIANSLPFQAATYYVAPNGLDINNGSINQPFFTLNKAWSVASSGDIIYLRGGTYRYTSKQELFNKDGSSGGPIQILAYPGEEPILDFINARNVYSAIGISNCDYLYIKGIHITNLIQPQSPGAGLYGFIIWNDVNHSIFEMIECDHIGGWGFVIGDNCNDDLFLNCDSHHNSDPYSGSPYGGSDGYECGSTSSTNITFRGCRAWSNSDDGFDLRQANGYFLIENCWSFWNGYIPGTSDRGGNGEGFKLGGKTAPATSTILRTVRNSLSFQNRMIGFSPEPDQLENNLGVEVYNSVAYNNYEGMNFNYSNVSRLKNNISYSNTENYRVAGSCTHDHNSFDLSVSVTDQDFVTVNTDGVDGSRLTDGSLPDLNFLHLATGSDLIDAGTDVGINYGGNAPDLGAFEIQDALPPNPVYLSSSIENATPDIITLKFDLALNESTVPAVQSFTVKVNSTSVTISSVTISSKTVKLRLANPVVHNNSITVSYAQPSQNSLQTTAGGHAPAFSNKTVTNNVLAIIPVYQSSSIEDATPNHLKMTYSQTLSNIIPATSSFTVSVNSLIVSVTTVSISGNIVNLTLAKNIVYGDIILISYTQPSSNPLQTPTGGLAVNITLKPVLNNCTAQTPQPPPVVPPAPPPPPPITDPPDTVNVVIDYPENMYGGFVGELSASTTDSDTAVDIVYEWSVPDDIPMSSLETSNPRFLAPCVYTQKNIEIKLTAKKGDVEVVSIIPITIVPYKPQFTLAKVTAVEVSDFNSPYFPDNVIDGDIKTRWTSNGDDKWLKIKLSQPYQVNFIELGFLEGQKAQSYFDIYGSADGITWDPVLLNASSCSFSGERQVFDFPQVNTVKNYSYIKYVGHGNSSDTWNNLSEIKIFGTAQPLSGHVITDLRKIVIFPNPVQNLLNIAIEEPSIEFDKVRIIDYSGNIVFEKVVDPITRNMQFPLCLKSGVYLVDLGLRNLIMFSQKLIVRD